MARVPDVPWGIVDVDGDADAFEAHIGHAAASAGLDEHGIATLADVMIRGRAGGMATLIVRGTDDFHYAAVVARDGAAAIVHLEERDDAVYTADIAVSPGEILHLTVVASDFETGMLWLEAQVAAGGMGMGGGPDLAAAAPGPPVRPYSDVVLGSGGGGLGGRPGGGFTSGRSPGLAPPAPPAAAPLPDLAGPPDAATPPDAAMPPVAAAPPDGATGADGTAPPGRDGWSPIDAHVAAQIPADLFEGIPVELLVTLSRDEVKIAQGAAGDDQPIKIRRRGDLRIAVQARGFDVADTEAQEVVAKLPPRGEEAEFRFGLTPADEGLARVTVTVTQSGELMPLATIELSTKILPAEQAPSAGTGGKSKEGHATVSAPPKALAKLPSLAIQETISRGHSVLKITARVGSKSATNSICLLDKAAYVDAIYRDLADIRTTYKKAVDKGTPARTAVAAAEESLRGLGTRIANTLLGDEVNALLWSTRNRLTRLIVQTSGELDIPWEIVHLVRIGEAEPDDASHFLGEKGLTRWLWSTTQPTTLRIGQGKTIAIAPDYEDATLKLADTALEVRALEAALHEKPQTAITREELRERIAAGFDLLHFAGHGRWRTADPRAQEIALAAFVEARDDGSASYRDIDAREDLPATSTAPFVFLSACDVGRLQRGTAGLGGFAEVFLRGGAGVFIGCSWSVRDDVTAHFAQTLYTELFTNNATIGDAVVAARAATRKAHDLTALAFTVFADPRAHVVRV